MPNANDGSLHGDVMRACLRRGISLEPKGEGDVEMNGPQPALDALERFVKEFRREIFDLLVQFRQAKRPARFARFH